MVQAHSIVNDPVKDGKGLSLYVVEKNGADKIEGKDLHGQVVKVLLFKKKRIKAALSFKVGEQTPKYAWLFGLGP